MSENLFNRTERIPESSTVDAEKTAQEEREQLESLFSRERKLAIRGDWNEGNSFLASLVDPENSATNNLPPEKAEEIREMLAALHKENENAGRKKLDAHFRGEPVPEDNIDSLPVQAKNGNPHAPGEVAFKRLLRGEDRDFAVLPTTIEEGLERLNLAKSATFTEARKAIEATPIKNQVQREDLLAFWEALSTLLLNEGKEAAQRRMQEANK